MKKIINIVSVLFGAMLLLSSCEDMEVASAALICHQYGIPFLGIRIISNTEFNNEDFQPETAKVCQQFVIEVAQQYRNQSIK